MCESCSVGPYSVTGHSSVAQSASTITTNASQLASKVLSHESSADVRGVQMAKKVIIDKSAELLAATDKYLELIKGICTKGLFPEELIEATMTEDCKRIFNGPVAEESRDAFMDMLRNFYKSSGPWKVTIIDKLPSSDTTTVTLILEVELGNKKFSEMLLLRFLPENNRYRINEVRANLTIFGAGI